jgi:hypothetical protein
MLLSSFGFKERKVFHYDSGKGITLGTYPRPATLDRTHPGLITVGGSVVIFEHTPRELVLD